MAGTGSDAAPGARRVICALIEGDFHLGLGALTNSLVRSGYSGEIWVGYRGDLPPWARPLQVEGKVASYSVTPGCVLRFVPLPPSGAMTIAKPDFMLRIWSDFRPEAEALFYFDVDIVVRAPWVFFDDWARRGVALCADVNEPQMSPLHPLRGYWRELLAELGLPCRDVVGYFNGGFVGIGRGHRTFLETWATLVRHLPGERARPKSPLPDTHPLARADQDMLNVAAMATDVPLAVAGPSAMDFAPGGYVMSHAIGANKPWSKRFVCAALCGQPPSSADKEFLAAAEGPIRLFAPQVLARKRRSERIAAAIGRFYRRR